MGDYEPVHSSPCCVYVLLGQLLLSRLLALLPGARREVSRQEEARVVEARVVEAKVVEARVVEARDRCTVQCTRLRACCSSRARSSVKSIYAVRGLGSSSSFGAAFFRAGAAEAAATPPAAAPLPDDPAEALRSSPATKGSGSVALCGAAAGASLLSPAPRLAPSRGGRARTCDPRNMHMHMHMLCMYVMCIHVACHATAASNALRAEWPAPSHNR